MARPSINVSSYLDSVSNKISSGFATTSEYINPTRIGSNTRYTGQYSNGSSETGQSGFARVIAYGLGIIIIVVVIALLIHHFVTPIYTFHPGAPGIITIPGFDDGMLFWNGSGKYPALGPIENADLPIVNTFYDYSLIMDIFIQNPMQFSKHPRILFRRGGRLIQGGTGDTLLSIVTEYNLVIALQRDTSDIIISAQNTENQQEDIILYNAPVQEPFRLGIVIMQNAMEAYINGNLMKTQKFHHDLKTVKNDINVASGVELNIAKIQNLKIWNRSLSSPEIRAAKPPMATAASFGATSIPSSTSCPTTEKFTDNPAYNPAYSTTNFVDELK